MVREITGGQFAHLAVIMQTVAAGPFSAAWFIRAIAIA